MSYIKTTISKYGTQAEFLEVLKNFFINNEVAPFTLVSEDLTADLPAFTVERNNLNIKFCADSYAAADIRITVSTKSENGEYVEQKNTNIYSASSGSSISSSASRQFPVLLATNGNTLVFQVAGYSETNAFKGLTVIDTVLENGTNIIGTGSYSISGTTITFHEPNEQQSYVLRPFHTGSNDETTLILSNQLAVNDSNGVYYSNTTDLISAGGAKQFGYYITSSNTYYGLLANVCIPMGDKVEYVGA